MTNAILYYRTPTTRAIDTGYTTPSLLLQNAPNQAIQFTSPSNIFEGADEFYDNIIVVQPSVNSTGQRTDFIRDNGMRARTLHIVGRLNQPTTDSVKLKSFRTILQQDTYHIHGIIGLYYPNAPHFSIDPTNTLGLSIGKMHIKHTGKIIKRAFFEIDLVFGGTHE